MEWPTPPYLWPVAVLSTTPAECRCFSSVREIVFRARSVIVTLLLSLFFFIAIDDLVKISRTDINKFKKQTLGWRQAWFISVRKKSHHNFNTHPHPSPHLCYVGLCLLFTCLVFRSFNFFKIYFSYRLLSLLLLLLVAQKLQKLQRLSLLLSVYFCWLLTSSLSCIGLYSINTESILHASLRN